MRIGQGINLELKTFDQSLQRGKADAAAFEASLLAEEGAPGRSEGTASHGRSTILVSQQSRDDMRAANEAVAREFLEWAQMSPEEKLRAQILKSKDLDEESLKALPPEEREAIETEIREAIKQAFGVDETAVVLSKKPENEASAGA